MLETVWVELACRTLVFFTGVTFWYVLGLHLRRENIRMFDLRTFKEI